MTDWQWYFSSDYRRDGLLRDRMSDLESQTASAHSSTARLTSQLARLQGSIETRLTALSTAFDAYVELGDVREQLSRYGDTIAIRREARDAFVALGRGRPPAPVGTGKTAGGGTEALDRYWLADATNAVIARRAETPDTSAEQRARAQDDEAELFMVAAAGAFGDGAEVGDRAVALLADQEMLDVSRLALFRAILAGLYGDVLGALGLAWDRHFVPAGVGEQGDSAVGGDGATTASDSGVDSAQVWVQSAARSAGIDERLGWLGQLAVSATEAMPTTAAPDQSSPPAPPDSAGRAANELRTIVVGLIEAGTGEEAALIVRAHTLRAQIEDPGGAEAVEDKTRPAPIPVLTAVREQLLAAEPGSSQRSLLFRWLKPQLLGAADAIARTPADHRPISHGINTKGGTVTVTPNGPDTKRMAEVLNQLTTEDPTLRTQVIGGVAATAVLAVIAILVAVGGRTGLAVFLLTVAVVAAGFGIRAQLARSAARREGDADAAAARAQIQVAVTQIQDEADQRRIRDQERADRSEQVVEALTRWPDA